MKITWALGALFFAAVLAGAAPTVSLAEDGKASDAMARQVAEAKGRKASDAKGITGKGDKAAPAAPAPLAATSDAPVLASAAGSSPVPAEVVQPGGKDAGMRAATSADNGAPNDPIWVKGRMGGRKNGRTELSLGNYVILMMDEKLPKLLESEKPGHRLGLYINDMFFKDLEPLPVPGRANAAMFHVIRTEANQELWSVLFTRKGWGGNVDKTCDKDDKDGITLTVGYQDGSQIAPSSWACLEYFPNYWSTAGLAMMALALLIFTVAKARTTSMIRDIGFSPSGTLPPFSLARSQMALWFITVVCSILFCYAVTGDLSPIPQGVLILMGIGAGTAVSAAAMDVNSLPGTLADYRQIKKQQAVLDARVQSRAKETENAEGINPNDPRLPDLRTQLVAAQNESAANQTKLKDYEVPASKGFFTDILADGNGLQFHRLQVFAWTMVFWVLFFATLVHKITLMNFDTTALALMGISGATYLGFKLQQQQKATGDDASNAGAAAGGGTPAKPSTADKSADGGNAAHNLVGVDGKPIIDKPPG